MQAAAIKQKVNVESIKMAIAEKMDSASFASWIAPLNFAVESGCLTLTAHNQFSADFINSVYANVLGDVAAQFGLALNVAVRGANMVLAAAPSNDNRVQTFAPAPVAPAAHAEFDAFVTSDENAFVVSACKKLAAGAVSFSPLYIYGPAGCGKSLLAGCINSAAAGRTLMMTGGQFVAEFARSLREHSIFAFKDFCRKCDTFILDDVHALAGKRATTEEFIQLIMDLRAAGKNIVLTANAAPAGLTGFDRRAQSLMASGLVADVAAPSRHVKRVMLTRAGVEMDVADALADRVASDGHLVAGVAMKIKTYAELMGARVDMTVAQRLLADTLQRAKTPLAMVKSMCEKMGVSYDAVCGSGRSRTLVRARQIMMTALKSATKLSLTEIGRVCGDRDHATVLYAISQIEKLKKTDLMVCAEIEQMIAECR